MALHSVNNSLALGINQLHWNAGEILALVAALGDGDRGADAAAGGRSAAGARGLKQTAAAHGYTGPPGPGR